jgi:hypothetical protein
MRRLILTAITLLGCCTPTLAPAQMDSALPRGWGDNHAGFATWMCGDSVPHIWIRDDYAGGAPANAEVIEHERSHAVDLRAQGSCEAAHRWEDDPQNLLASEVRAFCVSARMASKRTLIPLDAGPIDFYARVLADHRYYPLFDLTVDRATELIRGACAAALRVGPSDPAPP